jgi:hypothetical protein
MTRVANVPPRSTNDGPKSPIETGTVFYRS